MDNLNWEKDACIFQPHSLWVTGIQIEIYYISYLKDSITLGFVSRYLGFKYGK